MSNIIGVSDEWVDRLIYDGNIIQHLTIYFIDGKTSYLADGMVVHEDFIKGKVIKNLNVVENIDLNIPFS